MEENKKRKNRGGEKEKKSSVNKTDRKNKGDAKKTRASSQLARNLRVESTKVTSGEGDWPPVNFWTPPWGVRLRGVRAGKKIGDGHSTGQWQRAACQLFCGLSIFHRSEKFAAVRNDATSGGHDKMRTFQLFVID